MKDPIIPNVIYSVGELRDAFNTLKIECVRQISAEKGLVSTPAYIQATEVIKSLGMLGHFQDAQFIGLSAPPSELSMALGEESQPFYESYALSQYALMTAEEVAEYPAAMRKLG